VKAPGKVNLCLLVGAPRSDGLHPIVSVVQPVTLADEVTLAPVGDAAGAAPAARVEGPAGAHDIVVCAGVEGENLAARALAAFRAATGWDGPPQRLTIAKHIPVAAGMGGGSADAAAALRLASQASGLPIPDGLAMRLGADVPVLLGGTRALVTGAGEHVEPLPEEPLGVVIVPLDAALSTAEVYRAFDVLGRARSDDELSEAAALLRAGGAPPAENDLEAAARLLCPAIDRALDALRAAGAERVLVTGSGPTVFGVATDPEAVAARARAAGHGRAVAA
jgi:4-diphosphocytidyl-2-C-methyl-D-erythritol kinase